MTNGIITLANINHTLNKLNTIQEEKTMIEKTIEKYTTVKGNDIEIYQFRILLNGKNQRFLAFMVNGQDRTGCYLISELQMMKNFINSIY